MVKWKQYFSEVRRLDALINFDSMEVKATIKKLLQDKSTKKNIIWATDTYSDNGVFFCRQCANYRGFGFRGVQQDYSAEGV